ncbi:hypothetical protein SSS_10812, partial [Sarcoptes scabiei]
MERFDRENSKVINGLDCIRCRKMIENKNDCIECLEHFFHTDCFECVRCGNNLRMNRAFLLYQTNDLFDLFCFNCSKKIHNNFGTIVANTISNDDQCHYCDRSLYNQNDLKKGIEVKRREEKRDHFIYWANGFPFHKDCLRCSVCERVLDDVYFLNHNTINDVLGQENIIVCRDHQFEFPSRCEGCSPTIQHHVGKDRISVWDSGEAKYHIKYLARLFECEQEKKLDVSISRPDKTLVLAKCKRKSMNRNDSAKLRSNTRCS